MYKTFTHNYQSYIKTWKNRIKDIKGLNLTNLRWVLNNHEKIKKYIENRYTNLNTKKNHYLALQHVFKAYSKKKPIYNKLQQKYSDIATKLGQENDEIVHENKIQASKAPSWLHFSKLVERREELKKLYERDKSNKKNNYMYLLLSLRTLQPPIRQEHRNLKIVNKNPPMNDQNYLYEYKKGKYMVVLNEYKTGKFYARKELKQPQELNKIIQDSLKHFPRKYLLSQYRKPDVPLDPSRFSPNIRRLELSIFPGKRVTSQLYRQIYTSYHYPQMTYKQKRELAYKMCNSPDIASAVYAKKLEHKESVKIMTDDELKKRLEVLDNERQLIKNEQRKRNEHRKRNKQTNKK